MGPEWCLYASEIKVGFELLSSSFPKLKRRHIGGKGISTLPGTLEEKQAAVNVLCGDEVEPS